VIQQRKLHFQGCNRRIYSTVLFTASLCPAWVRASTASPFKKSMMHGTLAYHAGPLTVNNLSRHKRLQMTLASASFVTLKTALDVWNLNRNCNSNIYMGVS
jgi:hypothetical protein